MAKELYSMRFKRCALALAGRFVATLRVSVLCAYPLLGATIAFYVSAFSDQGVDLLLGAVEQLSLQDAPGWQTLATDWTVGPRAVLSGLSVVVAALSIWAPARLLLEREFRFFPIDAAQTAGVRTWLPRLLAAAVLLGVAVGYGRIAWRLEQLLPAGLAVMWAAFAAALPWLLSRRRAWTPCVRAKWRTVRVRMARALARRQAASTGGDASQPRQAQAPRRTANDDAVDAAAAPRAGAVPAPGAVRDAAQVRGPLSRVEAGWIVVACLLYGAVALAFACWPVALPRLFGGTALIFFGVGGLTFIVTMTLAYWPLARGRPTWTVFGAVAVAVMASWLDNHAMRPVDAADAARLPPAAAPAVRARDWETARRAANCPREGAPPALYVAAAGGGLRAAYWTTRVLEELSAQLGREFDCSLFALSGVSGGSLGAAAYVAVNRDRGVGAQAALQHRASESLGADFLSPAVAGLLFYDALQRAFFWPVHWLDRSRGLEDSFEHAFEWVEGRPFSQPLRALDGGSPRMPMVFLNATIVEDGRRAIASNVDLAEFTDVYDLGCPRLPPERAPSTAAITLAASVHNSARFTYVSPAGRLARLGDCSGRQASDARIVDGGYYENSGAATLAQLLCLLQGCDRPPATTAPAAEAAAPTRPVLLLIRNSPGTRPYCTERRADAHCLSLSTDPGGGKPPSPSWIVPEVASPLQALLTVRAQRERLAVVAAAEAFRARGGVVVEAYLPIQAKTLPEPPLGWSLSPGVRVALDDGARAIVAGCRQTLRQLFAGGALRDGCDRPEAAQAAAQRATRVAIEGREAADAARPPHAASASSR